MKVFAEGGVLVIISAERKVSDAADLMAATKDASVSSIAVHGRLTEVQSIRLAPGQVLKGEDENATIAFAASVDGLQLSADNRVHNIRLDASPEKRAIFNDTSVVNLGQVELRSVTTTGRVQILAREKVRAGHVEVNGLDIIAANARGESDRPQGYGVYVLQGAFTLWNMQPDDNVVISADLAGLYYTATVYPTRASLAEAFRGLRGPCRSARRAARHVRSRAGSFQRPHSQDRAGHLARMIQPS